jgi:hypothetical protein
LIVLESKPNQEDEKLATDNNFGIAYPTAQDSTYRGAEARRPFGKSFLQLRNQIAPIKSYGMRVRSGRECE